MQAIDMSVMKKKLDQLTKIIAAQVCSIRWNGAPYSDAEQRGYRGARTRSVYRIQREQRHFNDESKITFHRVFCCANVL